MSIKFAGNDDETIKSRGKNRIYKCGSVIYLCATGMGESLLVGQKNFREKLLLKVDTLICVIDFLVPSNQPLTCIFNPARLFV